MDSYNFKLSYNNSVDILYKYVPEYYAYRVPEADQWPDEQYDYFFSYIQKLFDSGLKESDDLAQRIFKLIDFLTENSHIDGISNLVGINIFENTVLYSPSLYLILVRNLSKEATKILKEIKYYYSGNN